MRKKRQSDPQPAVERVALSSGVIVVLPNESREDLDQLVQELTGQFEPKTGTERFLVDQMVHARWKLARYRRLEARAFEQITDGEAWPDGRIIRTLQDPGNIVEKLERLIAASDRAYSKAVRELTQMRAQAAKIKKQNEAKQAEDWLHAELANIQNEPIPDPFAAGPAEFLQNEPNFDPEPYLIRPLRETEEPVSPPPATE